MKDINFLYSVAIIALVGMLVCFIGSATNTLHMRNKKESQVITTTVRKKTCACCDEEPAKIVKAIRQNREKMNANQQKYIQATTLLEQYGLEEGLRKIKQSDPEIATKFERILLIHPADSKHVRSSP